MYIVTGGAGFIGSAIVWELNNRGIDNILVVDQLGSDDKWKNLAPLRFHDYMDKTDFRELLRHDCLDHHVEAIIHMGACSSTTEADASFLADNNYAYSQELANFANLNDIKFLYASSAATYGDGSQGYDDDVARLTKLRPLNMYGYSKQLFDLWLWRQGLLGKMTGFKFTNVFGPNEWHKGSMRSMVCRSYEQISSQGKIKLFKSDRPDFADGEQKRDFVYVKDVVQIVMHFLENDHPGLYNVGSGRAESWNSLAQAVFAALGKPPAIEYVDMPPELKGRYQYYTKANLDKLRRAGYTAPITPLAETVKDYVQNYLATEKRLGDGEGIR